MHIRLPFHIPPVFRAVACAALLLPPLFSTGCGGGGGTPSPVGPGITFTTYATGPTPQDVVMGDFDGDGNLDIATANEGGDLDEVVSLFIGDGAGGFAAKEAVGPAAPGTFGPIALAVGDLNGDIYDDLVIVHLNSDSYAVALGNANPTAIVAGAPVALSAGAFPRSAVIADFDGAEADLAVANPFTDEVVVYSGNGLIGAFTSAGTSLVTTVPWDLATGDIDGDTNLDIVTVSLTPDPADPWATVFLGDGAGGFVQATTADSSAPTEGDADVAVADLNDDGFDDIVRTLYAEDKVAVFFGSNTGELTNAAGVVGSHDEYAVGASPSGVALADTDGDTFIDIVTSNWGGGSVTVLLGVDLDSGTFGSGDDTLLPATPVAVATGNLDGNGQADIVAVHASNDVISVIPR